MTTKASPRVLLLALCLAAGSALADAEREIAYLLDFVASSGCEFQRNGSAHAPADAANHLRLKYSRGQRYATTAEQFIDRLATESSWTGEPYTVNCAGREQATGAWLHRALQDYRAGQGG